MTAGRLPAPQPAGLGTPLVESLISYSARVAADLGLTLVAFVRAVLPQFVRPSRLEGHSTVGELLAVGVGLNGMQRVARSWASDLGTLVGFDLSMLTCSPWSEAVAAHGLLRTWLAHCPKCLEEFAKRGEVYEPLAWSLNAITHCPVHGCELRVACSRCGGRQRPLRLAGRPGICGTCGSWLGGNAPDLSSDVAAEISRQVASLLTQPPRLAGIRSSLEQAIGQAGSQKALARSLPFPVAELSQWRRGVRRPSLLGLVRLCSLGSWQLQPFVDGRLELITPDLAEHRAPEPQAGPPPASARHLIDWGRIRRAIRRAAAADDPPSLTSLSKKLGVDRKSVRRVLPDEVRLLADRRAAGREARVAARTQSATAQVVGITRVLLDGGSRATRREVEALLPPPFLLRERRLGSAWRETRIAWAAEQAQLSRQVASTGSRRSRIEIP